MLDDDPEEEDSIFEEFRVKSFTEKKPRRKSMLSNSKSKNMHQGGGTSPLAKKKTMAEFSNGSPQVDGFSILPKNRSVD